MIISYFFTVGEFLRFDAHLKAAAAHARVNAAATSDDMSSDDTPANCGENTTNCATMNVMNNAGINATQ